MKEINPSVVQHWTALVTDPSFIVRLESFDECAAACCCELGTFYVFFLLLLVVVVVVVVVVDWRASEFDATMFTAC